MKILRTVCKVLLIVMIVMTGLTIASMFGSGIAGLVLSGNPGGALQKIVDAINDGAHSSGDMVTLEQASVFCATIGVVCMLLSLFFVGTLIFSIVGLKKLNNAKKKGDTLVIGILNIIFADTACGVLLIIISCLLPTEPENVEAQVE
ncbi:MAG: hypothetical protein MJ239_06095 [Bacilli bacterium]|nr:hypothetical protein [Bacilli bacterium]